MCSTCHVIVMVQEHMPSTINNNRSSSFPETMTLLIEKSIGNLNLQDKEY